MPAPDSPDHRSFGRRYCVVFESDDEGILVSVPALPGCFSFGVTRADAEVQIRDAAALYLGACLRDGDAIPDSEVFRPMIPSERCTVAFITLTTSDTAGGAETGGQPGESPVAGYEVAGASQRHVLIRRPIDHRKIVLPKSSRGPVPQTIQRMVNRVLIGDRSFHVPFYQAGK
jgi:predicted RNase H-like HicB family nuclease